MNPGICYLYEYEKNIRRRNLGFVKVTRHYQSCILQIHARGIPLGNGTQLELYAFYRDGDYLTASRIAVLTCFNRTVSVRLPVTESHFPENRSLAQIDGFLIKLPGQGGPLFWLASQFFFPVDPDKLRTPESSAEVPEEPASSNAPESEEDITLPAQPASPEDSPASEEAGSPEASAPEEDSEPAETPLPEENGASGETPLPDENGASGEPPLPEEPNTGNVLPDSPEFSAQQNVDAGPAKKHPAARKIQRADLSQLPRRFWQLANNSFLLHGYHNYNHLLLVEEDGHIWLGVPGVYDPREARAADLFGFPQFTRTYAPLIGLTEDECCDSEDFGHWCRHIDTERIK